MTIRNVEPDSFPIKCLPPRQNSRVNFVLIIMILFWLKNDQLISNTYADDYI